MSPRSKIYLLISLVAAAIASHVLSGGAEPHIPGLNSYYYDVLIGIGINIILAVGLNLVNGYTGQFSLGHAGFMAAGAYASSWLTLSYEYSFQSFAKAHVAPVILTVILCGVAIGAFLVTLATRAILERAMARKVNASLGIFLGVMLLGGPICVLLTQRIWSDSQSSAAAESIASGTAFVLALLSGGGVAALAGLIVGVPSLRLRGDYLAIVTLGFNEIIKGVIQNADAVGAQRGLGGMVQHTTFFWTFAFAAVTIYIVVSLVNSTYGRGFLAVRDDEIAAEAMGINTTKYKVLAFVLGAFFAGIAGGLYAHFKQFIHPEGFNFMKSVDVVVMVILGGMGSTAGVCVAAVLLTILPELLRYVSRIEALPEWLRHIAENRMIIYSLLLIILMLTRPQGLFGAVNLKKKKA